ncbi:MAG: hypothetical protein ACYCYO_08350 [Bacilli bacterium]
MAIGFFAHQAITQANLPLSKGAETIPMFVAKKIPGFPSPKVYHLDRNNVIVTFDGGFYGDPSVVEIYHASPAWHETFELSSASPVLKYTAAPFGTGELVSLYAYSGGNGSGGNSGTIYGVEMNYASGRAEFQTQFRTFYMGSPVRVPPKVISDMTYPVSSTTLPENDSVLMWPGADSMGITWYDPNTRTFTYAQTNGAQSLADVLLYHKAYVELAMNSNLTGISQIKGDFISDRRDPNTGLQEITIKSGEGLVFLGSKSQGYALYSNVSMIPPGPVQAVDTEYAARPVFQDLQPGLYTFLLQGTGQQIGINQEMEIEIHVM